MEKNFIYFPYHFSQVDLTSLKQDLENHSAGEMPTYPKRENEIHMVTLTVLQIHMWVKKHRNLKQPNVIFIVYHHKVLIEEGIMGSKRNHKTVLSINHNQNPTAALDQNQKLYANHSFLNEESL